MKREHLVQPRQIVTPELRGDPPTAQPAPEEGDGEPLDLGPVAECRAIQDW